MKNTTYMRRVFGHNGKPARGMDSFRGGRYERDGVDQCWNFVWDGNFSARDGLVRSAAFPMGHVLWGRGNGAFGAGTTVGVLADELIVIPERTVVATGGTTYMFYGMFDGEISKMLVHVFADVGSTDFVVTTGGDIEYLVVAGGGGGGGQGSGGGAGGLIHTFKSPSFIEPGTYPAVVGDGGDPAQSYSDFLGRSGGNSTFLGNTAVGGGGGRLFGDRNGHGQDGGSGGGATAYNTVHEYTGGSGTSGQGHKGGDAVSTTGISTSGGGGGFSEAGENVATGGTLHGKGGDGLDLSSYLGILIGDDGWFAGGGAGRSLDARGGKGGGGEMSENDGDGQSNTGGGGGGNGYALGNGGSGIVIVRYRI